MTDTPPLDTPTLGATAAEPVLANRPAPVDCSAVLTSAGPAATAAWDQFVSDEELATVTRSAYSSAAAQFLRWLQPRSVALTQVTPADVNEFLASRPNYRAALRHLFHALVAHGVVAASPVVDSTRRAARRPPCESIGPMATAAPDGASAPGATESEPGDAIRDERGAPDERYSKRAFERYWDALIASGEVSPHTGRSRKNVSLQYLELLPEVLQGDLRLVNLDAAIGQFESQCASQFQDAATIHTYNYRFRDALTRFLAHALEPTPSAPVKPVPPALGDDTLIVRLGENLVVKLMGMPHQLNTQQAAKLHRLIDAYVVEDGPD